MTVLMLLVSRCGITRDTHRATALPPPPTPALLPPPPPTRPPHPHRIARDTTHAFTVLPYALPCLHRTCTPCTRALPYPADCLCPLHAAAYTACHLTAAAVVHCSFHRLWTWATGRQTYHALNQLTLRQRSVTTYQLTDGVTLSHPPAHTVPGWLNWP